MASSTGKRLGAITGVIVGVLDLIAPTGGVFEVLPDLLPFTGQLDEAGASLLVLLARRALEPTGGDPVNVQHRNTFAGIIGIAVGALYLLAPTGGLLELLPDALPFIGSLDEAGATALLLWGINTVRGVRAAAALPPAAITAEPVVIDQTATPPR
jgi:uncharacterized membrane protein YkvA (DUF1232 family)